MTDFERIRELGRGQPAPRPEARDAARAALVARFEAGGVAGSKPARRRFLRVRNLAFAGSLAAVTAALLIALGTGGGSGVRPEVANAAELTELAEAVPHLGIMGGWQITRTEASPDGGETRFHYERDPTGATADIELRWQTASVEAVGQRLEVEGFEAAGTQPTVTHDGLEWRTANFEFKHGTAQVYVSHDDDQGDIPVVGVWRDEGWTFELRTRVESLDLLERRLERLEVLGPEEWLVAIRPGGAEWLRESLNGTVQKVETVRTELPDGTVAFETRMISKTPEQLEELDFTAPFPIIHREGDTVRVEIARAPG
jgi:hypothetical protein